MPRYVKVAAAQMGPINEGTGRAEVVERMLMLMDAGIREATRGHGRSRRSGRVTAAPHVLLA